MLYNFLHTIKHLFVAKACKVSWQIADVVVQVALLCFWMNTAIKATGFSYTVLFITAGWYVFSLLVRVQQNNGRLKNIYRLLGNTGIFIAASAVYGFVIIYAFAVLLVLPVLAVLHTCVCLYEIVYSYLFNHNNTPHKTH